MIFILFKIMLYTLHIHKTDYTSYSLISESDKINLTEPSLITGLFHLDKVKYSDNSIKLVERNLPKFIVGELELYSKYQFKPNKKGIPTYIFKPLDYRFPKFYVNSTQKTKYDSNIFITIEYVNWEEKSIFPKGNLLKIIGANYDKSAVEESLLLKYSLDNFNLKLDFKGITSKFEPLILDTKNRVIVDKKIISIDPEGCKDIDDALSIMLKDDILILDIHISDVYYLLSSLDIIDKIKNSTSIYLSNTIKHMLPTIISSGLGSLIEKNNRFMLTMTIKYDINNGVLNEIVFNKTIGKITKNYNYDNYPKQIDKYFSYIENIYKLITKQKIKIDDSHKFIEALMIIYNTYFCENVLNNTKLKIYRTQSKKPYIIENMDDRLGRFLKLIHSNSAIYSLDREGHATLDIDNYTHVTSPLRRLVDLMNQEIYYTNECTIMDRISLDKINTINKNLKKYYRDIAKLSLAHDVYNSECYETQCYIYDYNLEKGNVNLYFPKENISIKTNIINFKIYDLYTTSVERDNIIIKSKIDDSFKKIDLYKSLGVILNGKPNIYNVDKSIVFEFI